MISFLSFRLFCKLVKTGRMGMIALVNKKKTAAE